MNLDHNEIRQLTESVAEDVSELSDKLSALADPTRILILFWLQYYQQKEGTAHQEVVNVGDLVDHFELEQPTISHHLKILRISNIVDKKGFGLERFYAVKIQEIKRIFAAVLELLGVEWSNNLDPAKVVENLTKFVEEVLSENNSVILGKLEEVLLDKLLNNLKTSKEVVRFAERMRSKVNSDVLSILIDELYTR